MHRDLGRQPLAAAVLLAALTALAGATAVSAADQTPAPGSAGPAKPDFLFFTPTKSFSVRASWVLPTEQGDLFRFVRDQLTVDRGDFQTLAVAVDGGAAITPRLSILGGVDFGRSTVPSETRHYVGSDGTPITQKTVLASGALHASLKIALMDPGQRAGNYAWIPRGITPFAGAGGGVRHYNLTQQGQFVDPDDLSIFNDRFQATGWGPTAHVFGGVDVSFWRNMLLTAAGRYVWSHAGLAEDFVGFDGISLSAFRIETGISWLF